MIKGRSIYLSKYGGLATVKMNNILVHYT